MPKAFTVMQENFVPFPAEVTKIGLAKVNPYEIVAKLELKCDIIEVINNKGGGV